ncbi:H-NS family nucleoid-associated regulatory protein [Bradyrhizobium manausense]|uniref:Histidinol phosphate phosphatase n=1 Tax=Bradyrhizobium manausense TaxID=989370 RepID=A0A0R3DZU8_9BRAD|nr:H-NS histone family protein [Bradyrhizobium manausense]KRQ12626.1 histidinol phosphate phosphatase [Bradyrhizobium manausense]
MRKEDLEAMDFEELWLLHEELTKVLAEKITAEKQELEKRLSQLYRLDQATPDERTLEPSAPVRRKYPKVIPKYYNPLRPSETWSGRGKQPRWLVAALQSGHVLEEFKIPEKTEASDTSTNEQEHS